MCQLFSAIAHANYTLKIVNRQYPNGGNPAVLDPVADSLENQFNTTMASSNNVGFVTQVGNANAGSVRSATDPGVTSNARYSISAGVGGAIAGGTKVSTGANSLPPVGVAAQSSISIGANGELVKIFRGLDPKRVMYHLSFYTMDLSRYIGHGVTVDALQFSTGLSYQLYSPRQWVPGIRYNGIRVSSSASYASFNGSYTTPFTLSSGGVDMVSNVTLTVNSKVYTLSNQAITGIRLFWFLDLYTGLGIDFNFGSTTLTGSNSNGAVSAQQGGVTTFTGDAEMSGTPEKGSPNIAQFRWLVGTQLNFGPLGIVAQAAAATPSVYCLNLGAKIAF